MKSIVTTTILVAAGISVSACNVTTETDRSLSDEASSSYAAQINGPESDAGNYWRK